MRASRANDANTARRQKLWVQRAVGFSFLQRELKRVAVGAYLECIYGCIRRDQPPV